VRNQDARLHAALAILALGAFAGCAIAPDGSDEDVAVAAGAIEGGALDVDDHGAVGIAATDELGYLKRTCSGSLIAPNLVLTAQHCIADTESFVDCDSSRFGTPFAPSQVLVTVDPTMWGSDTEWTPVVQILLPDGAPAVCGRDMALLMLAYPIDEKAAPIEPRLDELVGSEEVYAAVGYGASTGDGSDGGLRRRRDGLQVVCSGHGCGTAQVEGREWRGDHGICNGDSGGPALDAAGRLIGVTSRGPVGCDDPIYGGLAAHKQWIRSEALRASRAGGYRAARWTGVNANASDDPRGDDARWASCSAGGAAPGGSAPVIAAITVIGGLAAIATTRRRTRSRTRRPAGS
jgi:hypothetical protein